MNIRKGQVFRYDLPNGLVAWGLIMGRHYVNGVRNGFDYIDVRPVIDMLGVKTVCFDEPEATDDDKDNVGLKHTFDVFTEICDIYGVPNNTDFYAVAVADLSNMYHVTEKQFRDLHCEIVDGCRVIDDRDMYVVEHHGDGRQKEKEMSYIIDTSKIDDEFQM